METTGERGKKKLLAFVNECGIEVLQVPHRFEQLEHRYRVGPWLFSIHDLCEKGRRRC